jgi:hypothetical protein
MGRGYHPASNRTLVQLAQRQLENVGTRVGNYHGGATMTTEREWRYKTRIADLEKALEIARGRERPAGWANDPEIAPLKYEIQRLRTELEAKSRELSNTRIERDAAWAQLRGRS